MVNSIQNMLSRYLITQQPNVEFYVLCGRKK